ncbi:HAD hydrolase-like protein [Deinococcus humi]|uniref:Phosphoglycolate phosphatase n=1 Tax=Deinococcus humi TaxID=662880 RepID=A0A7W8JW14_9DEIO|nr:HAD hydrolase-like protein [Deinococcus humi]MBB5363878.1 phosphoglycolate phosphatase [Deinococcus humi]
MKTMTRGGHGNAPHISHVAFDFDGTLADSPRVVVNLYNEVAQRRGYEALTTESYARLRFLSVRERSRAMGIPASHMPGMMLEVIRAYRAVTSHIKLHSGVPELLQQLTERGVHAFIVSTNSEDNIRAVLHNNGLERCVARVYASHHLFGKALLLRRLMRDTGIAPSRLAHVGDEERDVIAAQKVKAAAVAVTWGIDPLERLQASTPDHIALTPQDIVRFVAPRD